MVGGGGGSGFAVARRAPLEAKRSVSASSVSSHGVSFPTAFFFLLAGRAGPRLGLGNLIQSLSVGPCRKSPIWSFNYF